MQHQYKGVSKIRSGFRRPLLIAAAISALLLLHESAAQAQVCGTAYLNQQFQNQPCALAQPGNVPGVRFQAYLQNWWSGTGGMVQQLQKMTQQIYSYRVWQTWELARLMDVQDVTRDTRIEQDKRLTATEGVSPSDQVCVAGSSTLVQTKTAVTAAALTQGFKHDLLSRAHSASGDMIVAATEPQSNGSSAPTSMLPASDLKARWTQYCQEFFDPNSNDGQNGCNGASTGPVANDDISVENFLLRDTIDMNNPDEYKAAQAILVNIVQPEVQEPLTPQVLNSPQGQEYTLRLQHLEAIRNIAADVVGSIIARRAPSSQNDSTLSAQISTIRAKAGIPACPSSPNPTSGPCFSQTPSYNEIMLALTKERFYDPQYFAAMQTNSGAIQQEQDAVDGYTTVQLQDIYKMQEQINALLAARASLKLSTQDSGAAMSAAPQ